MIKREGSNGLVLTGYEIYRDKNVGDGQRVGFDTAEPTQSKPTRTRQGLGAPTERSITNQSIEGYSTSQNGYDNARTAIEEALGKIVANSITIQTKSSPDMAGVEAMTPSTLSLQETLFFCSLNKANKINCL